jgi:hypothetical protein
MLGAVSVANAIALAGTKEVVYSSWPLSPAQGAKFAEALLGGYSRGRETLEIMAEYIKADPPAAGLFGLIRP